MADTADNYTDYADPSDVASAQQAAYQKSQQTGSATDKAYSNIQYGVQQAFGGGPAMQQAKAIQSRLQSILADTNANSDPNEDPLTKQLRVANAVANGMVGVSPQIALKALDQATKISQAQKQQSLLSLKAQEEQEELKQEQYKGNIQRNTPVPYVLAEDQGKDQNGLPLGYRSVKSYDLSDPDAATQMRADMLAAKANGQNLTPMTMKDLVDNKTQAQIARGQYALQAAYINGANRIRVADIKAANDPSSPTDDRFANRIFSAADLGSAGLTNIANMTFGSNSGYFGGTIGAKEGSHLLEMVGGNLRNQLSTQDQQMYNTFRQGLGRNLTTLELQGGLQGGQKMAGSIDQALTIYPGDTHLSVMAKLAEARQILDRGTETYVNSSKADPKIVEQLKSRLDEMHSAVPFTVPDVQAFNNAVNKNNNLTYSQWAQQQKIGQRPQDAPGARTYSEADIDADMKAHNLTRDKVLEIYKSKGYTAAGAQ